MAATAEMTSSRLEELLGDDAASLLHHVCKTFPASQLHLPGPTFIDDVFTATDRSTNVLRNLQWLHDTGRLGGTGTPPGFAACLFTSAGMFSKAGPAG